MSRQITIKRSYQRSNKAVMLQKVTIRTKKDRLFRRTIKVQRQHQDRMTQNRDRVTVAVQEIISRKIVQSKLQPSQRKQR